LFYQKKDENQKDDYLGKRQDANRVRFKFLQNLRKLMCQITFITTIIMVSQMMPALLTHGILALETSVRATFLGMIFAE
jgi:hypothetical protein